VVGIYIGVLRCSVCHCFIRAKAFVGGKCPRFKTVEEMKEYKGWTTNATGRKVS
jgi:phage FluMu protein Com